MCYRTEVARVAPPGVDKLRWPMGVCTSSMADFCDLVHRGGWVRVLSLVGEDPIENSCSQPHCTLKPTSLNFVCGRWHQSCIRASQGLHERLNAVQRATKAESVHRCHATTPSYKKWHVRPYGFQPSLQGLL